MQITLVRHGESVSNAAGIWQGQTDALLSSRGEAQAAALAARLSAGSTVTRIVCSDLSRAHATAEAVASALSLPAEPERRWREIDLGRWEGRSREDVRAQWPDEVAALARGEDIPVGGGERWSDLGSRIGAAVRDVVGTAGDDEHVLIVAHGGVIITLLGDLLGVGPARPRLLGKLTNTSITSLRFGGGDVRVLAYNDGLHVDDAATWRGEVARERPVLLLRADADGAEVDDVGALFADRAAAEHEVRPHSLLRWSRGQLPPRRSADPAPPDPGSRSITTGVRPGGTLWTWNEGGAYLIP